MDSNAQGRKGFTAFLVRVIRPERAFYKAAIIYGIAVSLLTLAVPIATQTVINTLAYIAQPFPLLVLSGLVVAVLTIAAVLSALQVYVMELFQRRFFARTGAEIAEAVGLLKKNNHVALNGSELVARFFEIMDVQKSVPNLIIGGFALGLQTLVGLLVVSFYHPFLFIFNVVFVLGCFCVWRIWHRGALEGARAISREKYRMVSLIGALAQDETLFKSEAVHLARMTTIDRGSSDYVSARKGFFRYSFAQTVGFLFTYVTASGTLLALGGWLVIQSQLTLGQLVAAELILSAIFTGIARAGYYLSLYYELCVSAEKLDGLLDYPQAVLSIAEPQHA